MRAAFGLRAALMLLVLIAIAPVFAVVVQSSLDEQRARIERTRAGLRSIVELGAVHHQGMVEGARQLLTAIALAPPVYQDDPAACAEYMRQMQAAYPETYGTFGLLDREGRLTCRSEAPPQGVTSDDRPFFRSAVATGRFAIGEYTVSRVSGRPVLTFGLPVYQGRSKQLRGIAYAALEVRLMGDVLRKLAAAPEVTLVVTDNDAVVLASAGPDAPAVGSVLPPGYLRHAIAAGEPRFAQAHDSQGVERLFGIQPVGRPGERKLFVAGTASRDAVLHPLANRLRGQLAALLVITLLGAALAWLFADRVLLGPMRQLLMRVDALALEQQRLDRPPPLSALREFAELNRRFHEMARRLAERAVQRDGAMAEMEHQRNLFESVVETMAEGVLVLDRQGRFVHRNAAARRILPGLPAAVRLRGAPAGIEGLYELDGTTPCPAVQQPAVRALQGEAVDEFRLRARGPLSGEREKVIRGSARPIAIEGFGPRGAVVVFADVTHAHEAEEALRESESRYRTLFESNPHPMWVFDTRTLRFLTVNDSAVAHYGYSREEFLSMTIADIRPPEDVDRLGETMAQLHAPMQLPRVWRHRLKDGRIIHVEISSHALEYEGRPARMVLAQDVTARLRAEEQLRQLNETLEGRVTERTRELAIANQELESFSYSVSHDLRAPLQVIDGFGRALATRMAEGLDGQARHYLDRIRDNTRQMSQLIDDLLALARVTRADLRREQFDLAALAHQAVDRLRHRFPEHGVRVEIESPLPCVGDPRLMAIVMENLIGNAWKFSSRGAEPRIRVGREAGDPSAYYVADNGAGFDMAYADKLFKPFQRLHTASEFEGTGIGLATVHRIVSRHGGRVWAQSRPGEGAVFRFTLGGD